MGNALFRYSVFALPALLLVGAPSSADAACVRDGDTVTCTDQDSNGYVSPSSNGLRLTVAPGATLYNLNNGETDGACDELALPSVWLGDDSSVTNGGTIVTQGVCGWNIALGNRGAVVNRGQIVSYGVLGVGIVGADNLNVINGGGITTNDRAAYGIYAGDQAVITTEAGSSLTTRGDGANGIMLPGGGTIDNRGRIETLASAADGINAGAGVTVHNAGTIVARGSAASAIRILDRIQGGAAVIVNTGDVSALFTGQTDAPTHSIAISADVASFSLSNSGTVTGAFAAAQLAATGPVTLVNAGTMAVTGERRNDGSLAQGGGVILVAAGGNTVITNTGQITAAGGQPAIRISGGDANIANTGAIIGDVLSGGGDDTFALSTGSRFEGTFDGGAGSDTLLLTGIGEFSSALANVEMLSKSGAGTWTLHKALAFTRQANILDGVLRIDRDGVLTTPALNIITSGTLAGTGAVAGTVTNAGTLAPGRGMTGSAMLTILGAYVQDAAGTLALNVTESGNDSLSIGGTAALAGTLKITYDAALAASHFTGSRERRIVFAADSGLTVQGAFARVTGNAGFIDSKVRVTATGVDLIYTRLSYGAAAGNSNQRAAGEMLDRVAAAPVVPAALTSTLAALDAGTPESAVGTLAALAPETVPALQTLGLFTLQSLRDAAPAAGDSTYAAWGSFLNRHGSASRPGAAAFRYDLNGGAAGFSLKAGEALRVQALLARSSADAAFANPAAGAPTGTFAGNFAGLGASYAWNRLTASAGVIYGAAHPETRRVQLLAGAASTLSARGSAEMWSVYGTLATTFDFGAVALTPGASLARDSIALSRFDETAPLSATTLPSDAAALRADVSVRAEAVTGGVRPYLGLRLAQDLTSGRRTAVVRITGVPGSDFTIGGQRTRGLALTCDGGLAADLAPGLETHAGARFTANDVFAGHTLTAGLTYRW